MALKLGSHVSMSGGLEGAAREAASYGADTFMIYTGAPQNTRRKPVEELKIEEGWRIIKEQGMSDIVVHSPYIINLASYKEATWQLAKDFLAEELRRTEALGSSLLVLHPGSYTDKDLDYGIDRIVEGLDISMEASGKVVVCLETMAGKGTEVGRTFEELQRIIEKAHFKDRLGICFDTCHTHDSGYDIIGDFEGVLDAFDSIIGLDRLKVFHINGSLNPRGARKDRHANLGADDSNPKGRDHIGREAIRSIVQHPVCDGKPLILETPWLDARTNLYKEEIAYLRR